MLAVKLPHFFVIVHQIDQTHHVARILELCLQKFLQADPQTTIESSLHNESVMSFTQKCFCAVFARCSNHSMFLCRFHCNVADRMEQFFQRLSVGDHPSKLISFVAFFLKNAFFCFQSAFYSIWSVFFLHCFPPLFP